MRVFGATGLAWIQRNQTTLGWARVWRTLMQNFESLLGEEQRVPLFALAQEHLRAEFDATSAIWSRIWVTTHRAMLGSPLEDDSWAIARLWLAYHAKHPSWSFVWSKLLKSARNARAKESLSSVARFWLLATRRHPIGMSYGITLYSQPIQQRPAAPFVVWGVVGWMASLKEIEPDWSSSGWRWKRRRVHMARCRTISTSKSLPPSTADLTQQCHLHSWWRCSEGAP